MLLARESIFIHDWWLSPGTNYVIHVYDIALHYPCRTTVTPAKQGEVSLGSFTRKEGEGGRQDLYHTLVSHYSVTL